MHQRGTIGHRILDFDGRGKLLVFNLDPRQSFLRRGAVHGGYRGDRLARKNRAVERDDRMVFAPAGPSHIGTDIREIVACNNGDDAGQRFRFGSVDGYDTRVRVGAAKKFTFDHARDDEIRDVFGFSRDFGDAIDTRNRSSDNGERTVLIAAHVDEDPFMTM
jgi:hypothetical protein